MHGDEVSTDMLGAPSNIEGVDNNIGFEVFFFLFRGVSKLRREVGLMIENL